MGTYVELHKIPFTKFVNELVEKYRIEDRDFLEKIITTFGEVVGDTFIILNNEKQEEYNSYYNLSRFLDRYYHIEGSFDVMLELEKEMVTNVSIYEAEENLDVELDDEEEEE
ncbi:hypothetical protein [Bacillus cereus]|uniref:Uncharacterized protein n=1 Tax=Bacillus cereus HuA3-9 TaxID=1053205 RepID=R8CIB3_BACCE|nr:hypothetical protein [Bacillus cereus]EOO11359.1 hypothetical protein IGA_05622 [Bacillus cereus HuA3-9]